MLCPFPPLLSSLVIFLVLIIPHCLQPLFDCCVLVLPCRPPSLLSLVLVLVLPCCLSSSTTSGVFVLILHRCPSSSVFIVVRRHPRPSSFLLHPCLLCPSSLLSSSLLMSSQPRTIAPIGGKNPWDPPSPLAVSLSLSWRYLENAGNYSAAIVGYGDGRRGEDGSVLCIVEAKLPLAGRVPT